ncbi:MAG: hypothetical protein NTW50_04355 [Candidatus Berkelbacteria bacterium]|nr:hypothetical protein [Candidatus Berkelbacteria bacterium]
MQTKRSWHFVFAVISIPGSKSVFFLNSGKRDDKTILNPIGGVIPSGSSNDKDFLHRFFYRVFRGRVCLRLIKKCEADVPEWRSVITAYKFEAIGLTRQELRRMAPKLVDFLSGDTVLSQQAQKMMEILDC